MQLSTISIDNVILGKKYTYMSVHLRELCPVRRSCNAWPLKVILVYERTLIILVLLVILNFPRRYCIDLAYEGGKCSPYFYGTISF